MKYTKEQKDALRYDFEIIVDNDLGKSSKNQYLSNFDFYFDNYIIDHVDYDPTNHDVIFSSGIIKKFDKDRKSLTRATVRKLIESLYRNQEINDQKYMQYIGKLRFLKVKKRVLNIRF